MPIHDLQCSSETCTYTYANLYIPLQDTGDWNANCPQCGEGDLEFDLRIKTPRSTRSHIFPGFVAEHTARLTGRKEEIHSLADIRRIEREHQNENVCFEAFSFDNENNVPDPVSRDEPVRMTDDQKRDFMEKFRALDIKDERTARLAERQ